MLERAGQVVGNDAALNMSGTFHSVCARLLRRYDKALQGQGNRMKVSLREWMVNNAVFTPTALLLVALLQFVLTRRTAGFSLPVVRKRA